jgi:hypothetical protein
MQEGVEGQTKTNQRRALQDYWATIFLLRSVEHLVGARSPIDRSGP